MEKELNEKRDLSKKAKQKILPDNMDFDTEGEDVAFLNFEKNFKKIQKIGSAIFLILLLSSILLIYAVASSNWINGKYFTVNENLP